MYTKRVETWNVKRNNKVKAEGRIVVRNDKGQFHGSTNFRQLAAVGQVAKARRHNEMEA